MSPDPQHQRLAPLTALLGEWALEAEFPPGVLTDDASMVGTTTFEWALGGAFLLQRAHVDHPDAPDLHALIGPSPTGDGYLQHYFDSRGVARLYEMTFDGALWRLERYPPPPDFAQRFRGELGADGATITGAWEIDRDGGFAHDFALTYRRA